MTRVEPQARINIKYNHADSKVAYLVSLSCCHEYIHNECSILSFEIQVNLCEHMTNLHWSIVRSLDMLYIYNYIFIKNLIFQLY